MKKLSLICVLFIFSSVFGAGSKVAYIDSQEVFSKCKDMEAANEALETDRKSWDIELKEIENNLNKLKKEFDEKKILLSEDGITEAENKIKDLEKEREDFLIRVFGENGEAVQRNNELLTPIIVKLNKAIEKIALEQDIDIVLDSNSTGIMYAKPSLDITQDVIEAMESENLSAESDEENENKNNNK